jgi:phospholipid transport system transporter-binding protein
LATYQVDVSETAPGHFSVRGALTFETARKACELGQKLFKGHAGHQIEVDCSSVDEADSAGLAVLLEWLSWARRNQRTLHFISLPPPIRAVARISEVEGLLAEGVGRRAAAAA